MLDGVGDRLRREHNERAWLAWTTVMLPGSKEIRKFSDLTIRDGAKKPQAANPDAEFAAFAAWAESTARRH